HHSDKMLGVRPTNLRLDALWRFALEQTFGNEGTCGREAHGFRRGDQQDRIAARIHPQMVAYILAIARPLKSVQPRRDQLRPSGSSRFGNEPFPELLLPADHCSAP